VCVLGLSANSGERERERGLMKTLTSVARSEIASNQSPSSSSSSSSLEGELPTPQHTLFQRATSSFIHQQVGGRCRRRRACLYNRGASRVHGVCGPISNPVNPQGYATVYDKVCVVRESPLNKD
jgi:hypothetical protein